MQVLDRVSGLDLIEVPDSDQAQIRFGMHDFSGTAQSGFSGFGYYPGYFPASVAGDIWFNTVRNLDFTPGGRGFELILHELGHAVGLKHPHDGNTVLAAELDSNAHTVMSYNKLLPRAETLKRLDIEALTYGYGPETAIQSTYIGASNRIKIDTQLLGDQGVVIHGTHFDDLIIGTTGNDTLAGSAGNDVLNGGGGVDRAIYLGNRSDYNVTVDNGLYTVSAKAGRWVSNVNGSDLLVNVENISFLNNDTSNLNLSTAAILSLASVAVDQSLADRIYRFFNTETGSHFFTGSTEERNAVIGNNMILKYEGAAFGGTQQQTGAIGELEVYRFFNRLNGTHFYTASLDERDCIIENLTNLIYEGVSYYGFGEALNATQTALYRFYNSMNDSHFYTASADERDHVIQTLAHYQYEGIAYFVEA